MGERLADHLIIKIWTRLFLVIFFGILFSYGIHGRKSAFTTFLVYLNVILMYILVFIVIVDVLIALYMKKRLGRSITAKKRISVDNIGTHLADHLIIKIWIKLFFISFFGYLFTVIGFGFNNVFTSFFLHSTGYLTVILILVILIDNGIVYHIKKRGKDNDTDMEPTSEASKTKQITSKEEFDKADHLSAIELSPSSSSFCVVCGSDNVNVNGRCINCGAKLE